MNILFVDQFSDPGGAQLALLDVAEEVRRRGWKATILAPGSGPLILRAGANGIPTEELPLPVLANGRKTGTNVSSYLRALPRIREAILRAATRSSADIVYINGPRVLPAMIGSDTRIVFHAHSHVGGLPSRALLRYAIRATNATVIAASQYVAQSLGVDRCQVVYNGAPDFGGDRRESAASRLRTGIVGRIAPEKGQVDFIQAAAMVPNSASFTIYGDAAFSDPGYRLRVEVLARRSNVAIKPWRDDVPGIYREIDVLAVPSYAHEASTRVVMEAFAAGVAVVAYASGGIPEIVDNGRTGLLTSASEPQALADAIALLAGDRDLLSRLGRAAHAEWKKRFTKQSFQRQVCDIIEQTAVDRMRSTAVTIQA